MKRTEDVDLIVGKQLRRLRKQRGISQTKLATELGVSFQQIQKYENGVNRVGASRLQMAACALDVPISRFFEDKVDDKVFGSEALPAAMLHQLEELNRHFPVMSASLRKAFIEFIKCLAEQNPPERSIPVEMVTHKLLS